jgi:ubiquinol-cytochrome c reductase cytochrome c1 subunit
MRFLLTLFFITLFFPAMADSSLEPKHPKHVEWEFDGPFGTFDRESIQRGFKVYKEVCSACHAIKRIAFRSLEEIGFSHEEIKSLAASYSVKDGPNDEGEMFERPGRASDHIVEPYANDNAARAANNGALPPDLSLIVKARKFGADYVYSLLTGYETPPTDFQLGENMHYNPYFLGGGSQLAMPPPLLQDGQVEYTDGVNPSVDQMARDVVNFLQWTAEPEMEQRKSLGVKAIVFVVIFTILFYFAYKRIWRNLR